MFEHRHCNNHSNGSTGQSTVKTVIIPHRKNYHRRSVASQRTRSPQSTPHCIDRTCHTPTDQHTLPASSPTHQKQNNFFNHQICNHGINVHTAFVCATNYHVCPFVYIYQVAGVCAETPSAPTRISNVAGPRIRTNEVIINNRQRRCCSSIIIVTPTAMDKQVSAQSKRSYIPYEHSIIY